MFQFAALKIVRYSIKAGRACPVIMKDDIGKVGIASIKPDPAPLLCGAIAGIPGNVVIGSGIRVVVNNAGKHLIGILLHCRNIIFRQHLCPGRLRRKFVPDLNIPGGVGSKPDFDDEVMPPRSIIRYKNGAVVVSVVVGIVGRKLIQETGNKFDDKIIVVHGKCYWRIGQ